MNQAFNITLNQANRYLKTIKSSLATESLNTVTGFLYSGVELSDKNNIIDTSKLVAKALDQISNITTKTNEYFGLYTDVFKLESGLFIGNTTSGLSSILSELKYLKELKAKIQSLAKQLKNYEAYTVCTQSDIGVKLLTIAEDISVQKSSPQWDGATILPQVYLATHDANNYDVLLASLTKQISELENKRDKTNANYTIAVELSHKAQNLLGL